MNVLVPVCAAIDPAAQEPVISVSTALLVIALGLLIVVLKVLADLRAEVAALRERLTATSAVSVPSPPASQERATEEEIDPATLAVIAAAVHVALAGSAHRIAAVAPAAMDGGWSLEGRRQVFQSHQVR